MTAITTHADPLSEDPVLLRAFKAGDASVLTRVYSLYIVDITGFLRGGFAFDAGGKRYAFRGYKEPWHLENAIQETFIKAFADPARAAYDGLRPFRNYLFRISRNAVMDAFRKERRDLVDIEEVAAEDVTARQGDGLSATPETDLFDRELVRFVDEFVSGLKGELQRFFFLRFREGASVEACGRALGWSEYRVKKREKQIKKQFFKGLKQAGYLEGYRYDTHTASVVTMMVLAAVTKGGA